MAMISTRQMVARATLPAALMAALANQPAIAGNIGADNLRISPAHAPATPTGAPTAVVYLSVHNIGAVSDRLVRASTPIAAQAELHRSQLDGGIMRMRPLAGVDLPVGGSIEMSSGGLHLMLIGLRHPLKPGEHFALRLEFARAGVLDTEVSVLPGGANTHPP